MFLKNKADFEVWELFGRWKDQEAKPDKTGKRLKVRKEKKDKVKKLRKLRKLRKRLNYLFETVDEWVVVWE